MTEAYVSFEVAKLLKEKGFDEVCWRYWCIPEQEMYGTDGIPFQNNSTDEDSCVAPTHQMACAWLREVHNIFIEIGTSIDLNGDYHFRYTILDKECKYVRRGYTSFDWNYEDAVEAALKYTLENLI